MVRKKVDKCAECGIELCVGDKCKWIERRILCKDCSLVMRYKKFAEWDKTYPDIEIKETDIF